MRRRRDEPAATLSAQASRQDGVPGHPSTEGHVNRPEPISRPIRAASSDWSMRILEYGLCGLAVIGALLLGIAR